MKSRTGVGTKQNLVGTRNPPEPTFWVPTWNPEPTGTHFGPICLEPGTHRNPYFWNKGGFHPEPRNPWVPGFRTCRPLIKNSPTRRIRHSIWFLIRFSFFKYFFSIFSLITWSSFIVAIFSPVLNLSSLDKELFSISKILEKPLEIYLLIASEKTDSSSFVWRWKIFCAFLSRSFSALSKHILIS